MTQRYQAEVLIDAGDRLGEGAHWSVTEQALYWVDVLGSKIQRYDPADGNRGSWQTPAMPTALRETADGGLIATLFDGIYDFDPASGRFTRRLSSEPDLPANRCNDSNVGPDGRYWFGTMQNNIAPDGAALPITGSYGALYSLDATGQLHRHRDKIGISNTLVWNPAGDRFYFADSLAGSISQFDFDIASSTLGPLRPFAKLDPVYGDPDGSCMDAESCLWNARWDGGCVLRLSPEGEIIAVIDLPARRPTSVAFGGPDLTTLFITSASDGLAPHQRQHDGAVFAVNLPVAGLPPDLFGKARAH